MISTISYNDSAPFIDRDSGRVLEVSVVSSRPEIARIAPLFVVHVNAGPVPIRDKDLPLVVDCNAPWLAERVGVEYPTYFSDEFTCEHNARQVHNLHVYTYIHKVVSCSEQWGILIIL